MTATRLRYQYIVIREIASDELRITKIAPGYNPKADPEYTWGGPFKSLQAARKAVEYRYVELQRQLYPEKDGAS